MRREMRDSFTTVQQELLALRALVMSRTAMSRHNDDNPIIPEKPRGDNPYVIDSEEKIMVSCGHSICIGPGPK